jgi:toxin ParE1/3/4
VNVHWTATARRHLKAIHDYIARDSPVYARQVVARIVDRSEQISAFPESGRLVPEYGRSHVREVFHEPYRIIYRIKASSIDVIAVVHGARQLRRRP